MKRATHNPRTTQPTGSKPGLHSRKGGGTAIKAPVKHGIPAMRGVGKPRRINQK